MTLEDTSLAGVHLVHGHVAEDERGAFVRVFDAELFASHGLETRVAATGRSVNPRAGTLRGLHYQVPPHAECKLVSCVRGQVFDVVVDLREGSPTLCRWVGVELSEAEATSLYVPAGCAHGFQTLVDDTEVVYQLSAPHSPEHACVARWDDPVFGIVWPPAERRIMSQRDRDAPRFSR